MHMLVYALVDAPGRDSALSAGRITFDRLVGADPNVAAVFDYYVTFDEEGTTVAGPARWGDLPVVARVDSDDGETLLERAWEATEAEFERNLNRLKETLEEYSDEAIMRDEDLARHAFHQVGAYDGASIPLYDEYARGIRQILVRVLDGGSLLASVVGGRVVGGLSFIPVALLLLVYLFGKQYSTQHA